ncbi:unnamed protein product, partial [Mesorhabditis belari]|uniref:Uncharacterized protein n=1 Tax=Mesorhabditis belari TaxID=2138241 RepID=A0AAF3EH21_9BILA
MFSSRIWLLRPINTTEDLLVKYYNASRLRFVIIPFYRGLWHFQLGIVSTIFLYALMKCFVGDENVIGLKGLLVVSWILFTTILHVFSAYSLKPFYAQIHAYFSPLYWFPILNSAIFAATISGAFLSRKNERDKHDFFTDLFSFGMKTEKDMTIGLICSSLIIGYCFFYYMVTFYYAQIIVGRQLSIEMAEKNNAANSSVDELPITTEKSNFHYSKLMNI